MSTLTLRAKDVYGKTLYYPACNNAALFCNLLNCKTLTTSQLETIEKLGYIIELEAMQFNIKSAFKYA